MRLTPEAHLVGSGESGFGVSDPFDCHVYLLDGGSEAALVDAGIGSGVDAILANADATGLPRDRLRYVFLTHGHADHAGGAAALRERLPDVRVVASAEVAEWVATGDAEALSVEVGKRSDFYPADFRFRPCDVDVRVRDGDRVSVGELAVEVLETPGHADGHLAFLVEGRRGRTLFSGDLVFFGGEVSLANRWDCRIQAYAASMRTLRGARIEALLPGHHFVSLANGQRHIDAANRLFDRGFVPPSVV
ncbi:MAG TPA: MBL fold metallo-hydrolase [Gaiellaceae bacterium]|nr:MBL fold metallo-hydrolase [Gaiellaceae bacterium]